MLDRRTLLSHKRASKRFEAGALTLKPLSKRKLPPPLNRLGGPKFRSTDLIELGNDYAAVILHKTSDEPLSRKLMGYLFVKEAKGLRALLRLDHHPSHGGLHVHVSCESLPDTLNRDVVGGKKIDVSPGLRLDAESEEDQLRFLHVFAECCGIALGPEGMFG